MTQWTVYNVQWTMAAAYAYLQYGKKQLKKKKRKMVGKEK